MPTSSPPTLSPLLWTRPPLSLLFSHQVVSDSSRPRGLQHARFPCPSPSPGVCPSSCLLSRRCHPALSPSSPSAFNLSHHQGLFQWVSLSHQVAKVLELQHQSLQRVFRVDFLKDWLVWSPCCPGDSQESSPAPQFESINSPALCLPYCPALTSTCDYWKKHNLDCTDLCWQSDVFAFLLPTHSPCPCLCPHSCLCQAHPSLFSPASPSLTARICSGDKLPPRGGCPGFQGPLHFPLLAHYSHLHSLCLLLSRNAFTHCMPPTSALPRLEQGSLGCDSAAYHETPGGCLHQQHSQPSNRMGKEWVIAKLLGRSCVSPASRAFRVAWHNPPFLSCPVAGLSISVFISWLRS